MIVDGTGEDGVDDDGGEVGGELSDGQVGEVGLASPGYVISLP